MDVYCRMLRLDRRRFKLDVEYVKEKKDGGVRTVFYVAGG